MRRKDLETLFGFSYWMKDRVLDCAAKLTTAEFQAPSGFTTRDLRATLVHTLDVEYSWRARLQHRPEAEWKKELSAADYPRAADLIDHWRRNEQEIQKVESESPRPVRISRRSFRLARRSTNRKRAIQ